MYSRTACVKKTKIRAASFAQSCSWAAGVLSFGWAHAKPEQNWQCCACVWVRPGPAGRLPEASARRQFKGGSLRVSSLYSYRKRRLNLSFWPGLACSDLLYSVNLMFLKYWSMFWSTAQSSLLLGATLFSSVLMFKFFYSSSEFKAALWTNTTLAHLKCTSMLLLQNCLLIPVFTVCSHLYDVHFVCSFIQTNLMHAMIWNKCNK